MNFIQQYRINRKYRKGQMPKFIASYWEKRHQKMDLNTPLEQIRFVALDTETTGLDTIKDNVLSIGAIAIQDNAIIIKDALEIIVNAKQTGDNTAIKIHGLLPDEVEEGTLHVEAIKQFLDFLDTDVIVAHHTQFDVTMLSKMLQQYIPNIDLYNYNLDTAVLARYIDKEAEPNNYFLKYRYDLDSLCDRYNIRTTDRHTAWGDAFITAQLFLKLTRMLKDKGIVTLGQLLKAV